jgi:RimJ/RimL family protein N-acetyltransferase
MTYIRTSRLTLREYDFVDWPAVHEYAADPRVVRYMWWGPNSEADTQRFVREAIAHRDARPRVDFEFAVTLGETGTLIGGGSLNTRNRPEYATAEIGYCLAARVWGRGYGTEAVRALCEVGFQDAGLHRIVAFIDPENVTSIRLIERVGFRREGRLREDVRVRGEWRDSLVYALLANEWRRQANA